MPTNPSIHDLIKDYTNKKPDFTQYTAKRDDEAQRKDDLSKKVEELNLSEEEKQKRERQQFVRDLFRPSKPIISKNKKEDKMPVHPAEENVSGSITDQVAKDSSDSNASDAALHQEDTQATSGGSIGGQAHKANPGPVMANAEDIGKPASKEELKKRAEELNK